MFHAPILIMSGRGYSNLFKCRAVTHYCFLKLSISRVRVKCGKFRKLMKNDHRIPSAYFRKFK